MAGGNKHGAAAVEDVQGSQHMRVRQRSQHHYIRQPKRDTAQVSLVGEQIGTRYSVPTVGSHAAIKRQETLMTGYNTDEP